ncbi:MAG: LOG family protein [Saprospiraceae bacterium]
MHHQIAKEQTSNPYMTKVVDFDFLRKESYSYQVFLRFCCDLKGGTLDELFETLTLIKLKTLHNFSVVIMGKIIIQDLYEMVERMIQGKTISPKR